MTLQLSDLARRQSIVSIKRYFAEELDLDIGELKAGGVLDFVLKEIAPTIYNAGVSEAQTLIRDRLADLDGQLTLPEFSYWPVNAVRRKP